MKLEQIIDKHNGCHETKMDENTDRSAKIHPALTQDRP
jgi:hypothetical protein